MSGSLDVYLAAKFHSKMVITLRNSFVRFRAFAIIEPFLTNTQPTGTSFADRASPALSSIMRTV